MLRALSRLPSASSVRPDERAPAATPARPHGTTECATPRGPPSVEEIVAVLRAAGDSQHGRRLRGLIVVLWRAGLRNGLRNRGRLRRAGY